MINKTTIKLFFTVAALMIVPQITNHAYSNKDIAFNAGQKLQTDDDFPELEEVRRTFQLSPGANVGVSTIYGTVDIETTNSNTAEIHIIRYARSRADFSSRKINIEQSANGLAIRGERDLSREPARVKHRVFLKLPRQVSLSVEKINARVNIGEIEGAIRIERINGSVRVARAVGFAEVSNINGSFTMTISLLGKRGVRAEDINGAVELRFSDDLNADLSVIEFNGNVNSEIPNTNVLDKKPNEFFMARIGSGGIPISVTKVNGGIRLLPVN